MIQPKFLSRAKETYKFHRSKLLSEDGWAIADTAKSLRRSSGSISEDLIIAKWCKTHETQIEKFEHAYQALKFIREKQKEHTWSEIE